MPLPLHLRPHLDSYARVATGTRRPETRARVIGVTAYEDLPALAALLPQLRCADCGRRRGCGADRYGFPQERPVRWRCWRCHLAFCHAKDLV